MSRDAAGWQPPDFVVGRDGTHYPLRRGTLDDLDTIAALELVAQPGPWDRETFESELQLMWSHVWVVTEPHDTSAILAYFVFWFIDPDIHILNIATAPQARRKGLASGMLAAFFELARRNRATFVSLEVRAGNTAARNLYASFGFERVRIRRGYYRDNGEDAIVMSATITEPPPEG